MCVPYVCWSKSQNNRDLVWPSGLQWYHSELSDGVSGEHKVCGSPTLNLIGLISVWDQDDSVEKRSPVYLCDLTMTRIG